MDPALTALTLSAKQKAALRKLAESNPFRWKKQLRELWEHHNVVDGSDFWTTLYSLRNTHGPSWLARFRLSEVTS
jgi:hypothetical protein